MTDITERLRKWTTARSTVPCGDLMDEAAKEIEWLRQNRNHWMRTAAAFDDHLATLRVMLMEQPGGDKDTPSQQLLAAYQLGVRHRDPPDQVRNGAVESRETVQWIPVTERLPEEGVVVLAFLPNQADVESGVYTAMLSKLQTLKGTFSTYFGFGYEATHWMALPAPPAT